MMVDVLLVTGKFILSLLAFVEGLPSTGGDPSLLSMLGGVLDHPAAGGGRG